MGVRNGRLDGMLKAVAGHCVVVGQRTGAVDHHLATRRVENLVYRRGREPNAA
jgi:hypothetical protein